MSPRAPDPARSAICAMYVGIALSLGALAITWLDHATDNVLASHIRAGYPSYSQGRIDSAAATYLAYLCILAAVAVICWLWAIRVLRRGRRWARAAVTVTFLLGAVVLLGNLLVRDTSGQTGLPPLLGWVGLSPCLPGLPAVVLVWSIHRPDR